MNVGDPSNVTDRLKQRLLGVPFFAACGMYLWRVVEPRLIFNSFGSILTEAPPFLTGMRFFKDTLTHPGGFVMYAAGLLSQGFASSWLGAVIIVCVGLCLYDLCLRHLQAVHTGPSVTAVAATLGPAALFLIYGRYEHPLPEALAVCLGLLFSRGFETLPLRHPGARGTAFALMAAFGYWLMGAGGVLVFTVLTLVYGMLVHGTWRFAIALCGLSAAIVWCCAQFIFLIPPQQAFVDLTPFSAGVTQGMKPLSHALVMLITGWVPVCMVLLFAVEKLPHKVKSRPAHKKNSLGPPKSKRGVPVLIKALACVSMPCLLMGAGLYADANAMRKPFVQAHDYARHRHWTKMLDLGRNLPRGQGNVFVNHDIIRALYHTGRLPYDLFQFPQIPHGLLLTHETTESFLTQMTLSDLFIDMGQVNMAEKLTSEFLAVKGHNSAVVEQLAWINIFKGQHETARIYLHALRKDLIYRHAADALLHSLDHGFKADQLTRIKQVQSCMCHDPGAVAKMTSAEAILLSALQFNPANKMAYEYLMASYLLTGQIDKVVLHAGRLKALGYTSIPTLYEEAILIYTGLQGQKLDLNRFNVNRTTLQRYTRFAQLKNSITPQNQAAVLNRLIKEFGQTYLFYFTFGRVGLG